MTAYCAFDKILDDILRGRIVFGINDSRIQRRLLSEGSNLSLQKTTDVAQTMESAAALVEIIQSHQNLISPTTINKIEIKPEKSSESDYFRCWGKHKAETCRFKDQECFYCHNKDHTTRKCR